MVGRRSAGPTLHGAYEAACAAMVRFARTHQPNRDLAGLYATKYARYTRLLDALGPVWSELAWQS